MKLVEMKCKNCGAKLKVDSDTKEENCQFCGAEFKIDNEVHNLKFDDLKQSGVEFEKGKKIERNENKTNFYKESNTLRKKDNKTFWMVLAWLILFPFTASYYITKSDKLDNPKKVISIIAIWLIVFLILSVVSEETKKRYKQIIIDCYSEETYNKVNHLIGIDNISIYNTSSKKCESYIIRDSDYNEIKINMDEKKRLVSISVADKFIYEKTDNKKSVKNERTSKKTKKADYEFDTIDGYSTLQSLLINIKKGEKYKKIKNMADYYNFNVKKMSGAEDYGTVIVIYNDNNTENVKIVFDGYFNGKIDFFDYITNGFDFIYHYDSLTGYLNKYGEEGKKFNDSMEAFKYINQRIGFNG